MIKTKKLFEDFRKYAIEETGADCAEDEEEKKVDEGGPISMGHQPNPQEATEEGLNAFWATIAKLNPQIKTGDLSPDMDLQTKNTMLAAVQEWVGANTEMASDAVNETPRYGEEYADMDGEEPQGNDNPSQDVYAMLDDLRAKLVGTPLEGDVLAILDKMDAHPEMTDTKYPEPPMAEKLSESKKTIKLKINSKKKK